MKLVSMKLTPAQSESNSVPSIATKSGMDGSAPQYSYNTQLHLGEGEIKKLGLKMPKVGDKLHIHARGHVTGISHNQSKGEKPNRHFDIQLTHMHVGPKGEAESALDAMNDSLEK